MVTQYGSGYKAPYYDRNPTFGGGQVGVSNVAPHATTVRLNYTVPTKRIAIVTRVESAVERQTAATTPGEYRAFATSLLSTAYHTFLDSQNNAVSARASNNGGCGSIVLAGDFIKLDTSDGSTGGTVSYFLLAVATEFDA